MNHRKGNHKNALLDAPQMGNLMTLYYDWNDEIDESPQKMCITSMVGKKNAIENENIPPKWR